MRDKDKQGRLLYKRYQSHAFNVNVVPHTQLKINTVTTDNGKLPKAMLKGRRPTYSNDAIDVIFVRKPVKFMTLTSLSLRQ